MVNVAMLRFMLSGASPCLFGFAGSYSVPSAVIPAAGPLPADRKHTE